ncbi:MAG: toll/interleukin-1 receptor domain-containing protein [Nitrospirae bacterium]|nr:toll/interleukin-1 receptor domain-containing protein [Nitrospirota bacterium]
MANSKHLAILKQGVGTWNQWREANPRVAPDLSQADLIGARLSDVDLRRTALNQARLSDVDLRRADLSWADLRWAHLSWADLREANLSRADLRGANLRRADLRRADLREANLSGVDLSEADLSRAVVNSSRFFQTILTGTSFANARMDETVFSDVNLSAAIGLETCDHRGPSSLDIRTLTRSSTLPEAFLRGCGLPDSWITYLPSLRGDPIQFYSCFISHAAVDEAFVKRLYDALQGKGVRCWYAPEDFKTGDRLWDTIDQAIKRHDKLLIVLSEQSLQSEWVEREVNKAMAEENRRRKETGEKHDVLFPIRIDDAVMKSDEAWATHLRDNRHIGDFRRWKDHDAFEKAFERLLRDLKNAG